MIPSLPLGSEALLISVISSISNEKIMAISNSEKKSLRQLGHSLKPVVTVGDKGLSDNVLGELKRALDDHELIKVKLRTEEREDKKTLTQAITAQSLSLIHI